MSSPKEIAEKVIETQNRLDDIHSKLGIVSGYDEIVVIARAYLEFEKKHEYIHNKLLDDIEYQKSEITKLKEELNLGKSSLRCGQCGNIGMFHNGFAMADEISKLKKSREVLRKACEFYGSEDNWCRFEGCIRHDIINPSDVNEEELNFKEKVFAGIKAREAIKADDEIMMS